MLEEALSAEKKRKTNSRALEYATGMSAELTDSQMKVRELTLKTSRNGLGNPGNRRIKAQCPRRNDGPTKKGADDEEGA
jgi:hypothetical protein